ncbi:transglycosylase domain-containing protein [Sphingomonas sp. LY160]|uniref:transglycosylase domain-containing protein n=1 Tax=Sphingomonas sp. LY160 TaxID=3095342 RepID=UPI002ADED165|nr:transglycosylase domain-containing protein [Sphingomonas sp. LY160]MEA1073081.1 transglycosylase domain-containing protein [Sphingomonas sp. LY160]
MSDGHGIWQRGGIDIEQLPDPFGRPDSVGNVPPIEPPAPPRKSRRRWLRWSLNIFALLIVVTLVWLVVTAPLGRALEPLKDPAMLLLSEEGRPIARRGAIKDKPVEIARLDPLTPAAFIAIEDRRFRGHWGIDPRAIGRAMMTNFQAGGVRQGGSTITQQLAKTSFLSSDRSMKRKAQEVIIAFWLEAWLTKDDILSRYLSSVYFGDGVYGLRAASRHYFDREPERLTLAQSAMLAGMVQAPSRLAPTRNLALAQKRSRLVLQTMADTGVITQARAKATRSAGPTGVSDTVPTGTFFADWVAPQAARAFEADYGQMKVSTTLDADLQRLAVRAVTRAEIGGAQAALVAMRPDGRVVAMVGGRNYAKSPFNRATQARRQPGSAFKLFVYLAALRAGYTPDSKIEDRPITIDGWSPGNSDGVYRGTITLREAFARSSNAATVRLAEQVGRGNVVRAARDLGIDTPLTDRPSLALGTSGVSLVELTAAYAALAGGRYPIQPRGLPKLGEEAGGIGAMFARGGRLDDRSVRAPMLDLLWAAANDGTGRRAALATPTFGKTGTSQNNRDALFVGFAGDLVVGVWVGRDDNGSLGKITGGTAPASIWRAFMAPALSIDGSRGPALPSGFRVPQQPTERPAERRSPLPPEWSEKGDAVREILDMVDQLFQEL